MSTGTLDKDLVAAALEYHRHPTPGKISVVPTKALINQRDLALAYSPGVAAACEAIVADPGEAAALTSRGNLVGVVTNGTAVLGLGNIGPLAAKPVMEGKGCLFKKFAGIDVFDLELAEGDPDKLVDMIAALEPTLGGVNLEDIKAPECFYIEQKLRERMKIPVFHDDQHGTAIISTAALLNGLKVVAKDISRIKVVCSGAGAAAVACLDLMVRLGVKRENVYVCDSKGVIFVGREKDLEPNKARYAQETSARRLADIIAGADVFLGCSTAGVLTAEMVRTMAPAPLILALANPIPEILPDVAKAARPDCVVATGRSDFPNQVNNVLCFPFLFRGALDVGATRITEEMKLACVYAIAELAHAEPSELVAQRLRQRRTRVRARVHHPEAVRSAPDRQDRPGGGARGDGVRRGDAPDRGLRRVCPRTDEFRLSLRHDHAAGVRRRTRFGPPRPLRRGRGRARAAGRTRGARRAAGPSDPDRPTRRHRDAHPQGRPRPAGRSVTSRSSIRNPTLGTGRSGASTTGSCRARASRRRSPRPRSGATRR